MNRSTCAFCLPKALFLFGLASANEAYSVKEEIKILVQSLKGDDGKPKIKCALLNNSAYMFASSNAKTDNGQFQIRLRDESGQIVPQVEKWAEGFAQIGSNSHEHPRSFVPIIIAPGGKFEFQFDLSEAYGDRVSPGQKLEVEWDGYWPQETVNWIQCQLTSFPSSSSDRFDRSPQPGQKNGGPTDPPHGKPINQEASQSDRQCVATWTKVAAGRPRFWRFGEC